MKQISIDITRYTKPTTKANSERAMLVEKFVLRLNPPRIEAGFKPLTPARVAMLMSHIKTDELDFFYNKCNNAKNFSKCWWYFVK